PIVVHVLRLPRGPVCSEALHCLQGFPMTNAKKFAERLIKKYPNRRLYDTQTSAYITLADVRQLVRDNASFAVVDARSGEDITRSILLQIVVEEEAGAAPMLTCQALAQMIRCYGQA